MRISAISLYVTMNRLFGVYMETKQNVDQQVRDVLRAHSGITLAILFGSMADGTAGPESDLDLAVYAGRPITAEEKIRLIEELALQIGRPVDLVDMKTAGLPVMEQIFAKGRRIIGSNSLSAALLTRYQIDRADFLPIRQRVLEERRRRWIGA